MFCPKCGAEFTGQIDPRLPTAVFYCPSGDMPTSWNPTTVLRQRYGSDRSNEVPQSALPVFSRQFHGGHRWFCPGCGVRLNERLECEQCGKHLRDLVYVLVELHPHRSGTSPRGSE